MQSPCQSVSTQLGETKLFKNINQKIITTFLGKKKKEVKETISLFQENLAMNSKKFIRAELGFHISM